MKKVKYLVKCKSGFKEAEGYLVDVVYDGERYDMVARSETLENGRVVWQLDDLQTGLIIKKGFSSRKNAIEFITHDLMEKISTMFKEGKFDLTLKAMADFKAKQLAG